MPKYKHFGALRCTFAGGERAVLFSKPHEQCAFGTLVDECDNCIGAVFVIFGNTSRQRPSGDCEVVRLGASDSREPNYITGSTAVEVQARETSFVLPSAIAKMSGGAWKFGDKFFRTVLQYLYEY